LPSLLLVKLFVFYQVCFFFLRWQCYSLWVFIFSHSGYYITFSFMSWIATVSQTSCCYRSFWGILISYFMTVSYSILTVVFSWCLGWVLGEGRELRERESAREQEWAKVRAGEKALRTNQAWWCTPIIPALGRQRQEDHKFKASLNYIVSWGQPQPHGETLSQTQSVLKIEAT
jgi:hypothetical protein